MEYFIVVKETARSTEESSYEHQQSKRMKAVDSNTKSNWFQQYSEVHFCTSFAIWKKNIYIDLLNLLFLYSIQLCCPSAASQADTEPTSDLGTNFDGLDAREKRDAAVKEKQLDKPSMNKFVQDGSPVLYTLSGFINMYIYHDIFWVIILVEKTLRLSHDTGPARPKQRWELSSLAWWASLESFGL